VTHPHPRVGSGVETTLTPSDEPSRFGQQDEWQLCANFVPIRRGRPLRRRSDDVGPTGTDGGGHYN
jgi:hypothetical protein